MQAGKAYDETGVAGTCIPHNPFSTSCHLSALIMDDSSEDSPPSPKKCNWQGLNREIYSIKFKLDIEFNEVVNLSSIKSSIEAGNF